jgi:hypothetical protein
MMKCTICAGRGGWSQRIPGPMYVKCPTCGGTGVLYTQAEMQTKDVRIDTLNEMIYSLKAAIDVKNHVIEKQDKMLENLADQIVGYPDLVACDLCDLGMGGIECVQTDCIKMVIAWARKQVEEETK